MGMLKKGVNVRLLEKKENEGYFIIKVSEQDGEYNLDIEASRENSQKPRVAADVRKDGGLV